MTDTDTAAPLRAGDLRRSLREFREIVEAIPPGSDLGDAWSRGVFALESHAHDRLTAAVSDANSDEAMITIDYADRDRLMTFVRIAENEGVKPTPHP